MSAIFSHHFDAYEWGAVARDGYGMAYMTGFGLRAHIKVTSERGMPNATFRDAIARAAENVYALHVATEAAKVKL